MAKCSHEGCERPATRRGMCGTHYRAWHRRTPAEERAATRAPVAHDNLVGLFGGIRRFCAAVGIDPTTLYRWKGAIPVDRHAAILDGAVRAGDRHQAPRGASTQRRWTVRAVAAV